MATKEAVLFQVGQRVVWKDVEHRHLSFLKNQLGEGPFTVCDVMKVPLSGRFDADHPQWLKINGYNGKLSGYWFEPA